LVTIQKVDGSGIGTASGAIEAPLTCKLWVRGGETFIAEYNAAEDVWYSKTPDVRKWGREQSFMDIPNAGSTTVTSVGVAALTMATSSTYTAVATATSSVLGTQPRITITPSVTTANAHAGASHSSTLSVLTSPTTGIVSGYKARFIGATNDALTGGSFMMGVFTGSLTAATQPSAYLNSILLAADTGEANMSVMHNDGGVLANKVPLGAGFPATGTASLYEFIVEDRADGVTRFTSWIARNLVTFEEQRGVITTDRPVENTAHTVGIGRQNHADSGIAFAARFGGIYAGAFA
jgi:hypothetical protein